MVYFQQESVIAFPGSAFSAPGWIRLVITHPEDTMAEAATRISSFCNKVYGTICLDSSSESSDEGCDLASSESDF